MNDIKISVLIPVHNMGYAIGRALESLVNQTNQNFDVLIALDACTDNTESVINSYEDKLNITYFNVCNRNVGKTRDALLDRLDTDLYTFLDADDELTPNAIETALTIPTNVSFVRFCKVIKFLNGIEQRYTPDLVAQFVHGIIFNRGIIARYGVRFGDLDINEDASYLGRLVISAIASNDDWLETCSNDVIYIQNENEKSTVHTTNAKHMKMQNVEGMKQIYNHFKTMCSNPGKQKNLVTYGMLALLKWAYLQRDYNNKLSPLRFIGDELKRYEVTKDYWNRLIEWWMSNQIGWCNMNKDEIKKKCDYFKL